MFPGNTIFFTPDKVESIKLKADRHHMHGGGRHGRTGSGFGRATPC